jgi:hypothetical protein
MKSLAKVGRLPYGVVGVVNVREDVVVGSVLLGAIQRNRKVG